MGLKRIKVLLAEYYEGKTDREEERQLKDFFLYGDVPPEMETDRMLFVSLSEASSEEIPDKQFDEKFFAAIGEYDNNMKSIRLRRILYAVSGIAAGLLLVIGSYFLLVEEQVHDIVHMENAYSIDETRLAYEEAKNALLLVSRVMSTNTQQLEALSKMTDAASGLALINKFHQGAGELQVLYKFEETKEKITIKQ